ncbi:MAG: SUMF1/EgtB/PvdO family nonheme iron enzyme [Candidatus Cloacimonetes bacterium]|nr:SUMF1/EgtB/PvdO family nonheme iron enzyme [Candidatus Cloacimonadota bacterium]
MKQIVLVLILLAAITVLMASPQVSSVMASQRSDASKKVDIYYNLLHSTPVRISLQAFNDYGLTWVLPTTLVTGDIGADISPGNGKHIVWDVLAEHPQVVYEDVRFIVVAYEGESPSPPVNFVFVPGGTFTMGDTRGGGNSNELPTHSVTLNSFYLGKYEVTQSEWQTVMGSNPASGYGVGANYPVYNVSWYAILKYCNLRSMAEGLTPAYTINYTTNPEYWGAVPTSSNSMWNAAICNWSANGYRLPTEAEWEYAARGATSNPDYLYSGSDDINAVAWYWDNNNSGGYPSGSKPVGLKVPNGLGLYDMSGNVGEWCWDWYGSSYYSSSPGNNPTGPASGSYRVKRGGLWYFSASSCRVAYRSGNSPYGSDYGVGFRLCRAVL